MIGLVTAHLSISLDGYVAGPDQSLDNPLGVGGVALHQWHFAADEPGHEADAPLRDHLVRPGIGAYLRAATWSGRSAASGTPNGSAGGATTRRTDPGLTPVEVVDSPWATHIRYAASRVAGANG